jgi:hypothetical protein
VKPVVLYLIGHAGAGKYTIASAFSALTGAVTVDNHLINNPLFSVIVDGKTPLPEGIWDKVEIIRRTVLETIQAFAPTERSFVFTNVLFEDDPDAPRWFNQVERLAEARKSLFLPVRLYCDEDELCRRIAMPDRAARFKESRPERARTLFRTRQLLTITHPHLYMLDVTNILPTQAANAVLQHAEALGT